MGDPPKWDVFVDGFGREVKFQKVISAPKKPKPIPKPEPTSLDIYRQKIARAKTRREHKEVMEFQVVECPACAKRYGMMILATGLQKTEDGLPIYPCEAHRVVDSALGEIK